MTVQWRLGGESAAYSAPAGQRLAGAMMSYSVVGTHRVWNFLTSADTSYYITATDADQPAAVQAQHDTILATLRLDDTASGCS